MDSIIPTIVRTATGIFPKDSSFTTTDVHAAVASYAYCKSATLPLGERKREKEKRREKKRERERKKGVNVKSEAFS